MNSIDRASKVIFVGSSGVGKTSIINAYLQNPFQKTKTPTVAPASTSITVQYNNKDVELNLWDTAGQERFRSVSAMFYRESVIAVVCFEAKNALESIKPEDIEEWIKRVKLESPDCIIFLTATKNDMCSPDEKRVLDDIGSELAQQYDAKTFIQTSSKENYGINELIGECAKICFEVRKDTKKSSMQLLEKNNQSSCLCG